MIRNLPNTLNKFRGKHTILDYSNFFIRKNNLDNEYMNIKTICRNILISNHLNIVDESGSVLPLRNRHFSDLPLSPDGFTLCYLLDESSLTFHSYTNCEQEHGEIIGKAAIDLFTCCKEPIDHHNAIRDLNKFLIENYDCKLDKKRTIDRF